MSITSTVTKLGPTTITGLPQTIPVTFPFQLTTDLLVLDSGTSGTGHDPALTLTLGSDYTVTGGGYNAANQMQTGSISVLAAGANNVQVNDQIVIMRAAPLNQIISLNTVGPTTEQLVEQAIDKVATLSQQMNEITSRCLRMENFENLSGNMSLAARKSNVVGFDSSGNPTFYAFSGSTIVSQSVAGTANQVLVNGTSGTPQTGAITLTLAGGALTATGTANQVLVNGTSGSPQANPFTLTLPQAIGTTSQPQFGKLGIGIAAQTTSDLQINHSLPPSAACASLTIGGVFTAGAGTALFPNAFRDTTVYTAVQAADAYTAYDTNTTLQGTVPLNHYYGYQARHLYSGTNTLDIMAGFVMAATCGAGTITEMRAFYVPTQTLSGGTVTHFAGLFIDQLTIGTTRHAIYHNGNDPWFSAGGQIFTSQDLTPPAGATTCRMGATFDQASQTGVAVMNRNATATGTFASFCNSGGTVQGTITQTNSTTTAYNTTSDARLKENFRDLANVGDILDALRPRLFDWRWGGKDAQGFVAQELFEVCPDAVTKGSDDLVARPWQVDFSKLVPVLTAALKDQRAEIETLHSQVAALMGATS